MLGIDDPLVCLAYILCLGSTLLCGVHGLVNWNREHDQVTPEDLHWATRGFWKARGHTHRSLRPAPYPRPARAGSWRPHALLIALGSRQRVVHRRSFVS